VKRRLFNMLAGISLMLCVGIIVLWWRSRTTFESFYVVTRSGVMWSLGSAWSVGIMRVGEWHDPAQKWHTGWNRSPPLGLKDHSLPLLIFGGFGGARSQGETLMGVSLTYGDACAALDSSGDVLLGPPFPADNLTKLKLSRPMPFWSVNAPHNLVSIVLASPALLMLGATSGCRIFRYVRRRSGRCPACGYDLRATPDCCPECGAVPQKFA
jgi:hypothetical protein